ncbi:MAG: hypothetical protein GY701_33655 [Sulfitobacter sp.]|nr:hypothetical protein [Sulfitobacter sp.]
MVAVDMSSSPPLAWLTYDAAEEKIAGGVWIADGVVHGEACDLDGTEYGAEHAVKPGVV